MLAERSLYALMRESLANALMVTFALIAIFILLFCVWSFSCLGGSVVESIGRSGII